MKWTRDPFKQVRSTLEHLRVQEDSVLVHWAARKKSLDVCLQYVIFEKSAQKVRAMFTFFSVLKVPDTHYCSAISSNA